MASEFNRRTFVKWTGVGATAAVLTPALAACGSSGAAGAGVSNAGKKLSPWPTLIPSSSVHYDLPALPNNGSPAVLRYPALPLKASVSGTPGDGSSVTALTFSYGSPVKLDSSNQLLAAVSKALGVNFQPNFVVDNGTSFTAAQTSMQASGSYPDLMSTTGLTSAFIEAECADLTPYLSGDAVKEYPNLASIPTRGWELNGRIGGKLHTVPIYRYSAPLQGYVVNRDRFQAAGAWGTNLSANQLSAALQPLAAAGHTPLASSASIPFGYPYHLGAAAVPRNWQLHNGTFTHMLDTPQFQQAVSTMRDFYTKGLFNADAATAAPAELSAKFLSQSWYGLFQGLGGVSTLYGQVNGAFDADILYPYGSSPTVWGGDVVFGSIAVKKSSPDRIRLLLRVLNFLAAPFGSKEWELLNFGIEGVHFTRGADGSPSVPTTLGKVENSSNLPFKYLAQQPQPIFQPGAPKVTQSIYDSYKLQLPIVVSDPSAPYQSGSPTSSSKGAGLGQAINSAISDVVSGKQPLSSWTGTVAQLKSQFAVDRIAAELAAGYTAAPLS